MGAKAILLGLWLVGFALGFFAYFASPAISEFLMYWLPQIFTDVRIVGAFLSGIAGSIFMTFAVIVWSYTSRRPY